MSGSRRTVINEKKATTDRLPEWANEGAVLVEWLHERGLLDRVAQRLQIQREGGYVGLDLVVFLVFFLTSKLCGGIKGFGKRVRPFQRQLAAMAGRKSVPAPPSVSRILGAVDDAHGEALGGWLLIEACEAATVLRHPSVRTRDATGREWHVFDLDPTTTVLRQRALPEFEDMPPARRRAVEAQPGYTGRKRGDVQLSRMTLQHAGSGLWMGLWTAPGNGEWREHSEAAIQRVGDVCEEIGHPLDQAFVRVDGAGGNVPLITTCQEAGLRYLTRWSQYGLLEEPELRAHLNGTSWVNVIDSGSGPRRHAAEIGWVELHAAADTLRSDGTAYPPVRSRLVVSRFRAEKPDKKRGAGTLIEGWQYELYATDLPPTAWPAAEVVTTYYGRCGEENRFYQEDQELGLDRIFSYNIAGQHLANVVGLFLWNLRICRGMDLANVPRELPLQLPSSPVIAGATVVLAIEPAPEALVEADSAGGEGLSLGPAISQGAPDPTEVASSPAAEPVGPSNSTNQDARVDPKQAIRPDADAPTDHGRAASCDIVRTGSFGSGERSEACAVLRGALTALDWPNLLDDNPGWRWDPEANAVVCPNEALLSLNSVKSRGLDRTRSLRFVAPYGTCPICPIRAGCHSSESKTYRKELWLTVPTTTAFPIQELLAHTRGAAPPSPPTPLPPVPRKESVRAPKPRPPRMARPPLTEDVPVPQGRLHAWDPGTHITGDVMLVTPAILLPAKLRQAFTRASRNMEVHVSVEIPLVRRLTEFFATTAAHRQQRRLTWPERNAWNALPPGSDVRIAFAGGDAMAGVLRSCTRDAVQSAA